MEMLQKWWKALREKTKGKKNLEMIIVVVLVLIILAIYFSSWGGGGQNNEAKANSPPPESGNAEKSMEERLESVLSKIGGAGQVKAMITYESSSELVPAMSQDRQTQQTEENDASGKNRTQSTTSENQAPITVGGQNGTQALVLREDEPAIRGVIIVAQGASSVQVRLDLIRATTTVLNIPQNKVDVFVMQE